MAIQRSAFLAFVLSAAAGVGSGQTDPATSLDRRLKETGLSAEQRLAVWKASCAAEDRANWEANRLYDPVDEAADMVAYKESARKKYRMQTLAKYKIAEDTLVLIEMEAFLEKRKPPPYPSCDVVEVAKGLDVNVVAGQNDATYHRAAFRCPLKPKGEGVLQFLTLHEAITAKGAKACPACKP